MADPADLADLSGPDTTSGDESDTSGGDARERRRARRELRKAMVVDETILDENEDEEEGGGDPPATQSVVHNMSEDSLDDVTLTDVTNRMEVTGETSCAMTPQAETSCAMTPQAEAEPVPALQLSQGEKDGDVVGEVGANDMPTRSTVINIFKNKIDVIANSLNIKCTVVRPSREAYPSGASGNSSTVDKTAYPGGAVQVGLYPSGGPSLVGQSNTVNNVYNAVHAIRKNSRTNISLNGGGGGGVQGGK